MPEPLAPCRVTGGCSPAGAEKVAEAAGGGASHRGRLRAGLAFRLQSLPLRARACLWLPSLPRGHGVDLGDGQENGVRATLVTKESGLGWR